MQEIIDRITELEIRYSHQVCLVEELSDEVRKCHRRIDVLERSNRRFQEMLKSLAPDSTESPDE